MSMQNIALNVAALSVSHGIIRAVDQVGFEVVEGEICALIGSNGAGKSSILGAISGLHNYSGNISFAGEELRCLKPEQRVSKGIAHVPEGRGIFGNLTVWENLKLATWQSKGRRDFDEDFDRVFSIFPRLKERMKQNAGTLSGGEQQMLALGRALMTRPRLLLLDEPSMGLAPALVREIFEVLREINLQGVSMLLVEQNANLALRCAARAFVLENGRIVMNGLSHVLRGEDRIKEVYLGT